MRFGRLRLSQLDGPEGRPDVRPLVASYVISTTSSMYIDFLVSSLVNTGIRKEANNADGRAEISCLFFLFFLNILVNYYLFKCCMHFQNQVLRFIQDLTSYKVMGVP